MQGLPAGRTLVPLSLKAGGTSELALQAGWNLISLAKQPGNPSPAAVFAGAASRVFAYDACDVADPWKVWDPANPAGSDLTAVDVKKGLWAEVPAGVVLPVAGTAPATTTLHLCAGWNLIGAPVSQPRSVAGALSSIEGKYARVFGYDAADPADPWDVYDVAVPAWADTLQLLEPGKGYWVFATAETDLVVPNQVNGPAVQITSPLDLSEVTTLTSVVGTVTGDRIRDWTLSYRAVGDAQWTVLVTGTGAVVNATLGTFDPTLLLNGDYQLELKATDGNNLEQVHQIDVAVEGQQKIGNFTLTYNDLEIPLSGLPIQILRTYDSRDKRQGDFGIGWTLDIHQGSYKNNRKPGDGWQFATGFLPCQFIRESLSHVTTIRLSDREIYRFKLALGSGAPTLGGCFAQARFNFVDGPIPGATLDILGNTQVFYGNGSNEVIDASSLEIYEPQQVRLTTRDGRIFDLDLQQGVTHVKDLNGNELSITPTSLTHSSGRAVVFERDAQGRVTRITDPEGEHLSYEYDAAGDLVKVTGRAGQTTRFAYNASHGLLDIQDARGIKPIRNEYDANGRLLRNIDAFDKVISYTHNLINRQETITDRLGHTRLLEYDSRGNILRELDANGKEVLRTFDNQDNLLTEMDPLGNTIVRAYDGANNLIRVTDPLGNTASFSYNGRSQLLTVTDARGKVTTNAYDSAGNQLSSVDPAGNMTTYTYDSLGNLLSVTAPENLATRYDHDSGGNVIVETDALGTKTTFTYDRNGRRLTKATTRTTTAGQEALNWSYTYDASGRLVQTTDPDGSSTQTVYDALDRVVETVDKLQRRTKFGYDEMSRVISTSYPDDTLENSSYDPEGRQLTQTDRGGRVTRYEYDAVGRRVRTILPDGATLTNAYDDAGRLTASIDARGNATTFSLDAAGRRTKVRDALGNETVFVYDQVGNQTGVTDAKGQTTVYEYDDVNRLVRIRFPDGTSQEIGYDRFGRKVSATDAAGKVTRFGYDTLGRLTSVTNALNQMTSYAYDELGQRIAQTDAKGRTTFFEYDKLGRPAKRILPLGTFESFAYDATGNLVQRRDFKGQVVSYEYDLNNRLIRQSYPNGESTIYTYTATGQRSSVTDSQGTTSYSYDNRDRVMQLRYPDGRSLEYSYDLQGNRQGLTARIGTANLVMSYSYDALDRLQTVTDPAGRKYTYQYDANGNRSSLEYPNGLKTNYTYDRLNRLTNLATRSSAGSILQSHDYTLGQAGNRTQVVEHDGTKRSYQYDALYRLTQESVTASSVQVYETSFTYDPVGNRLSQKKTMSGDDTIVNYSYDDRDRLLAQAGSTYTWDENGNLIAKSAVDATSYVWDFDNRLVKATKHDGAVVSVAYDADGNRVREEISPSAGPSTVTQYLVDPTGDLSQVVAETDAGGNLLSFYVRGDDLLAVIRSTGARFYHSDGSGSVRLLTNEVGEVTDTYTYSAFGELLSHTGTDPNHYLFAGEPFDSVLGFYYNRARWMDVGSGRFVSFDVFSGSISDPISLHKYLYAGDDPVDNRDPSGLFGEGLAGVMANLSIQGALVGGAVGAVLGAVNGAILGGWRGALYGAIGGAATGALLGAIGGGLTGLALVTTTVWPLIAYSTILTGWGIATSIRNLASPNPRVKVVGGIGLVMSIVGGVFSARAISYVQTGRAYMPQYQKYAKAYETAPDVPELDGPIPDGKYIYVVRMNRTIVYYNRGSARFPHPNLSGGQNVLTAGELEVMNGKVTSVNNQSGHFQPPSLSLQIAKLILQFKGLWGPESVAQPYNPGGQ